MPKSFIIAIDGPAGSGKSTTAKIIAKQLGFLYIDTGAMYRAVTLLAIWENVLTNNDAIIKLAREATIELLNDDNENKVFLNGKNVTDEIRSYNVNQNVSPVSKIEEVREALVNQQRLMAKKNKGIVMEGRDIGTVVFPDADVKIFLTAAIDQRADRRSKEYQLKGNIIPIEEIKSNLVTRDKIDSTRQNSPLSKAKDAYEVDTSLITIEEQVEKILKIVLDTANKKNISIKLNRNFSHQK